MQQIRDEIQRWLDREERTQAYLARKAGINESYLSMILSGQRVPGIRALRKLEAAMALETGKLQSMRNAERCLSQGASERNPNGGNR